MRDRPRISCEFQSHAGSIEAGGWSADGRTCGSFNPTLVRLRLMLLAPQIRRIGCFNPTLVRLRAEQIAESAERLRGFNPTLVRLRVRDVGFVFDILFVSIPRWFD